MKTKLARSLFSLSVIGVISYFFINRLSSSWNQLNETASLGFSIWIAFAISFMIIAVLISGLLWGWVLNELAGNRVVNHYDSTRIHAGAWLLKYVPGQVGSVLYKISWGKKHGINRSTTAWSFIYENVFLTIASVLPTSVILLLFGDLNYSVNLLLVAVFISSVLLLINGKLLKKFINILSKKAKAHSSNFMVLNKVIRFSLFYTMPRIINGFGFVLIAHSLFGVAALEVLPLIAAYTLAGIIGIYAIFVPSGLGVREAMIVILTAGIFSVEQAALLALLTRFYATIADGILAAIYAGMSVSERGVTT